MIYKKSFGYKNLETKDPAKTDDIYVLFSQTKAIVAVAFMTLYEQGLVELDDPISKYIPGFSDMDVIAYLVILYYISIMGYDIHAIQ